MGVAMSTIFTKAKGSFGNMTVSTQKGRIVFKEKPVMVLNPKTAAQEKQRSAMRDTIVAYKTIGKRLKHLTTSISGYGNPYSQFVKENIELFKEVTMPKDLPGFGFFTGVKCVNGRWAEIKAQEISCNGEVCEMLFNKADMPEDLKQDDKVVIFIAGKNGFNGKTFEKKVSDLKQVADDITLTLKWVNMPEKEQLVYSITLKSADGRKSSSSVLRSDAIKTEERKVKPGTDLAGSVQFV